MMTEERDGGLQSAASQRLRPAEAAAGRAQATLKKLLAKTDIQFSESFEVDGTDMYKHACSVGSKGSLEGA